MTYINLGNVAQVNNNLDQAFEYYERSNSISKKELFHNLTLYNQINLSAILKAQRKPKKAIDYLNDALKIVELTNDKQNEHNIYFNLGCLYNLVKDYQNALFYFKKIQHDWSNYYSKDYVEYLNNLSFSYAAIGNLYKANLLKDSVISLQDSIFKYSRYQSINELSTQFESKEKQQRIELLEKEKQLSETTRVIYLGSILTAIIKIGRAHV